VTANAAVGDFDLLDPAVLGAPYDYYATLREQAPVHLTPYGFWLISRYDDVLDVVRDPERFSSQMLGPFAAEPSPEVAAVLKDAYPGVPTLLTNDPPSHTRFRNLVNKAFTPKRVGQMEGQIRAIADDLVDQFVAAGEVELVSQFAVPLPLTVIADALGVDRADMPAFKRWSDDSVAPLSGLLTEERKVECAHSRVEMQRYMVARIDERRAERRDDLLSDLVHARLEVGEGQGAPLTVSELLNVIEQLLVAGNETTTKLLTSGMLLLLEQPTEMAKVRADPALIPNLVEEALRYESPVQMLFRTTTTEVEVAGVSIPAGAACLVVYGSANRDDRHFPSGADFDVERANARTHLAFGQGPHYCVGAALARAEARIGFEVLLDRLDDVAVAPANTYERELSMVLRGWKALHLTFTANKEGAQR
jgi:cytochrome P450